MQIHQISLGGRSIIRLRDEQLHGDLMSCLPSEPAICSAFQQDGQQIIEVTPLPGRSLPSVLTVVMSY